MYSYIWYLCRSFPLGKCMVYNNLRSKWWRLVIIACVSMETPLAKIKQPGFQSQAVTDNNHRLAFWDMGLSLFTVSRTQCSTVYTQHVRLAVVRNGQQLMNPNHLDLSHSTTITAKNHNLTSWNFLWILNVMAPFTHPAVILFTFVFYCSSITNLVYLLFPSDTQIQYLRRWWSTVWFQHFSLLLKGSGIRLKLQQRGVLSV